MRLGVIIFTLGAAFVAGGITAPATNAVSAPVLPGAPKGRDHPTGTSIPASAAWRTFGFDSYG